MMTAGEKLLTGAFLISGAVHLLRPQVFEPIVPRVLPGRRALVLGSGVAELVCAAGLLHPRSRGSAGLASAALLVAVLPANVQMAVSYAGRARHTRRPAHVVGFAGALLRVPLQWPLIRIALGAARRGQAAPGRTRASR